MHTTTEHKPMHWVETTADFTPFRNEWTGRQITAPHYQVVAITEFLRATGRRHTTYLETFNRLNEDLIAWTTRPGRKSRAQRQYAGVRSIQGTRLPSEFYRPWLALQGYHWVALTRVGVGTTIRLDDDILGTDTGLARMSSDTLVLIKGNTAYAMYNPHRLVNPEPSKPEEWESKSVYGVWVPAGD